MKFDILSPNCLIKARSSNLNFRLTNVTNMIVIYNVHQILWVQNQFLFEYRIPFQILSFYRKIP